MPITDGVAAVALQVSNNRTFRDGPHPSPLEPADDGTQSIATSRAVQATRRASQTPLHESILTGAVRPSFPAPPAAPIDARHTTGH